MAAGPDVESTIDSLLTRHGFDIQLNSEQKQILKALSTKKNVLSFLPAKYEKSIIYTLLPLLLNELHSGKRHTSVVVSPIKEVVEDQLSHLKEHDVSAAYIADETDVKDIEGMGDITVLFLSPKVAGNGKCDALLKTYEGRACVLVFYQELCIYTGSEELSQSYENVVSRFDVPKFVVTESMTNKFHQDMENLLGLDVENFLLILAAPDTKIGPCPC